MRIRNEFYVDITSDNIPVFKNEVCTSLDQLGELTDKKLLHYPMTLLDLSLYTDASTIDSFYDSELSHYQKTLHYDYGVSIAGMHHLHDTQKKMAFRVAYKSIKTAYVYSDVIEGSNVGLFLDEFVGKYNYHGHEGNYLNPVTEKKWLEDLGFEVTYTELNYPWVFNDEEHMFVYCTKLFGLDEMDKDYFITSVKKYLNVTHENGKLLLHWQLGSFHCVKK